LDNKSSVKRELQARFREWLGLKYTLAYSTKKVTKGIKNSGRTDIDKPAETSIASTSERRNNV
jgi:hypothetical protein